MIDIIFSLNASDASYQASIGSWLPVVKGNLFAHVVVSKVNEGKLPDIIDWLLDHDIRPLVSQAESGDLPIVTLSLLTSFVEPSAEHTLLIQRGTSLVRVDSQTMSYLAAAIDTFAKNKDVLTTDIISYQMQDNHFLIPIAKPLAKAMLVRSRDLYLSSRIMLTNGGNRGNMGYASALFDALSVFTSAPYRHLAINPSILLCS